MSFLVESTCSENIEEVYSKVCDRYPGWPFRLASGGLPDVKGPGTSDVDISLLTEEFASLENVFVGSTVKRDAKKSRIVYCLPGFSREVNIYATSDPVLAERAVIHRQNELKLSKFQLLTAMAIAYKTEGLGTEAAWAKALGLTGDPYENLLRSDLEEMARGAEGKILAYINALPKP
eukprot:comp9965_c0_seq1/m.4856 comp9965_c0_seq1/g.4856  ORF comp9965_c0_seq1/g.4856 comp9965_c0_seq1/m.4856 type:complete len:177 (-) comp9965_c0_seq1:155-685(-)